MYKGIVYRYCIRVFLTFYILALVKTFADSLIWCYFILRNNKFFHQNKNFGQWWWLSWYLERLLPIPEVRSSNPVIDMILCWNCVATLLDAQLAHRFMYNEWGTRRLQNENWAWTVTFLVCKNWMDNNLLSTFLRLKKWLNNL